MNQFDVHVCLVSDQPTPNLVPILAYRPKEVILVVTQDFQEKADILAKIIKERTQAKIQQIAINNEFDMLDIEEKLLPLLIEKDKSQIVLNATGGTKLMAFAALDLFRKLEYSAFYYANHSIFMLNQNGIDNIEQAETIRLRLEDYLAVHGYSVIDTPKDKIETQWLSFAEELVKRQTLAGSLGVLNAAISAAKNNEKKQNPNLIINLEREPDGNLKYLLDLACDCNLLNYKNKTIQFTSVQARDYVGGIWLEEYIFHVVKNIDGVQDCAMGVQIDDWERTGTKRNELDIAIMFNNTLYIIECKTRNYLTDKIDNNKKNEPVYILDSLKKLGGIGTKLAMISYRGVEDFVSKRAKGADIVLWQKNDLQGLVKHLNKWIKNQ